MNIIFKISIILLHLYYYCICFKPTLCVNNNVQLKKNYIDRNIYAKYLKDIKKTKKFLSESTKTLIRYGNETNYDVFKQREWPPQANYSLITSNTLDKLVHPICFFNHQKDLQICLCQLYQNWQNSLDRFIS